MILKIGVLIQVLQWDNMKIFDVIKNSFANRNPEKHGPELQPTEIGEYFGHEDWPLAEKNQLEHFLKILVDNNGRFGYTATRNVRDDIHGIIQYDLVDSEWVRYATISQKDSKFIIDVNIYGHQGEQHKVVSTFNELVRFLIPPLSLAYGDIRPFSKLPEIKKEIDRLWKNNENI